MRPWPRMTRPPLVSYGPLPTTLAEPETLHGLTSTHAASPRQVAPQVGQSKLHAPVEVLVAPKPLPLGLAFKRSPLHAKNRRCFVETDGTVRFHRLVDRLRTAITCRDVGFEVDVQAAEGAAVLNRKASR